MAASLSHLRVLDLSRVLAGPWCTQILADLGARVIKIEKPGSGDDTRGWGPPFLATPDGAQSDSAYFASTNRGKHSVAVDMARPEGQEILRKLASRADVVVENFKVGGLEKYGLDYPSLANDNPRLVYCSITGFGQTGPMRERAGYDFMIQGLGGIMSITGQPDGAPGAGPMKVGVAFADVFTGLYATIGILAALQHRDRTGQGQHVDLALLDSQVAVLANQALNFLVGGQAPPRLGNAHPNIVPYQTFATRDGHLIIAVGNDAQFRKLCEILGLDALPGDARFASNEARVRNREALIPLLAPVVRTRSTAEWIAPLEAAHVPCGPIQTIDQVFAHPQVLARDMKLALHRDDGTEVPGVGNPIRMSATPVEYRLAPPALGSSTRAVLAGELGMSEAELDRLAEAGIIGTVEATFPVKQRGD